MCVCAHDVSSQGLFIAHLHTPSTYRHLFLNNSKLQGTISVNLDNLRKADESCLGKNKVMGALLLNI